MNFSKYHGLGNDFILVDDRKNKKINWAKLSYNWCQRHYSIGADGLIVLANAPNDLSDFKMQIFNADSSEAEMCGNGLRCFLHYLYDLKLLQLGEKALIQTKAGILKIEIKVSQQQELITAVNLGTPSFAPQDVPIDLKTSAIDYPLSVDGKDFAITCVNTGPPHTVIFVDDLAAIDVLKIGPQIANNSLFPQKTNVNFAQIINNQQVKVITYERGVGLTQACGTGSSAVVCAGVKKGLLLPKSEVLLPAGSLRISLSPHHDIMMEGPSEFVFSGYKEV